MVSMADLGDPLFADVQGVRIRYVRNSDAGAVIPVLLLSPFPRACMPTTASGQTCPMWRRSSRSTFRDLVSRRAAWS
jgi:hypothetical protein